MTIYDRTLLPGDEQAIQLARGVAAVERAVNGYRKPQGERVDAAQLVARLKAAVEAGEYDRGERFPGEFGSAED